MSILKMSKCLIDLPQGFFVERERERQQQMCLVTNKIEEKSIREIETHVSVLIFWLSKKWRRLSQMAD